MDLGDKVILREVRDVPETRLEDLIGCTGYRGPAKTLKEMEAGIAVEAGSRPTGRSPARGELLKRP